MKTGDKAVHYGISDQGISDVARPFSESPLRNQDRTVVACSWFKEVKQVHLRLIA